MLPAGRGCHPMLACEHEGPVTAACPFDASGTLRSGHTTVAFVLHHAGMHAYRTARIPADERPRLHRPLRIALVTETWPPEVNGVATTIARVVEGLHDRQHELQLIRPRQDRRDARRCEERLEEILLRGLPIPGYPHLRMGTPSTGTLLRHWAQRRPDVVHIATEGPLGWSALRAARRLRLAITSDFRTNFHTYSGHYRMSWLHEPIAAYLRGFHNRTAYTMVPTPALRSELEVLGFERMLVVARGVDTACYGPSHRSDALRSDWGAGPGDIVVLYVGRLAREKNLDTLLLAFKAMRGVNPRLRLVLVGDGPLRAELQARCPDAVFAGVRTGHDLAAHYASGDLLLFPSLTETYGNVTLEAMASGVPAVAYNYAAAAQLIEHGRNGMLVSFGNPAAFMSTAEALADRLPTIREMGLHARHTAQQLDWGQIIGQIESVFVLAMLQRHAPGAASSLAARWEAL